MTLMIDRRFPGVGRIQRHSGTDDPQVREEMYRMLKNLSDLGRVDVLNGLKNNALDFVTVYDKWRKQELGKLAVVESLTTVQDAFTKWLDTAELSEDTIAGYKGCTASLVKMKPRGVLTDLPEMVRKLREQGKRRGIGRSFNQTEAVVQSYLRHHYGRHHPLWLEVSAVKNLPKGIRSTRGLARSVKDVQRVCKALKHPLGKMFWTMCVTGMNPKEYWGDWTHDKEKVVIHGTKRKARERVVPVVDPHLVKPGCSRVYLRNQLKKIEPTWKISDGRKCFSYWTLEVGIPLIRRKSYMGHVTVNLTDFYAQHELDTHLTTDGKLLRDYIKKQSR